MFRSISRNFFLSVVLIATACAVCFGGYKAVKITYTISGSTGIGGAVMKGLPGDPVCDENGDYSVIVDYGFKGSIVPTKEGYKSFISIIHLPEKARMFEFFNSSKTTS